MTDSSGLMRRPIVVGLGELLWDNKPEGMFVGGAPANFAYHANQLGAEGVVVSCLSHDKDGDDITARFEAYKQTTEYLYFDERHPTGRVTVTMDAAKNHDFFIHTGVAWDHLPFDDKLKALAERADAVCFGTLAQRCELSRASIQSFVNVTGRNCLRVFDINLRENKGCEKFYNAAVIRESLASADVLKLNHNELQEVVELLDLPESEPEAIHALIRLADAEIARLESRAMVTGAEARTSDEATTREIARLASTAIGTLIKRFPLRLVALTCAGAGSVLYTNHRVSVKPGYVPSEFEDSIGAGDSFTAALVLGLLRLEDLDAIHERAGRLASDVCSRMGATPMRKGATPLKS